MQALGLQLDGYTISSLHCGGYILRLEDAPIHTV